MKENKTSVTQTTGQKEILDAIQELSHRIDYVLEEFRDYRRFEYARDRISSNSVETYWDD